MFWGYFNGSTKGPCVFWEKDWGYISSTTYMERIVPIVHRWIRMNPGLSFMQDSAPGHAARATIDEFRERGIKPIHWPPYSPDLNPIEVLWGWMKDYIEVNWGVNAKLSYDEL
jgi:hypothetical protein